MINKFLCLALILLSHTAMLFGGHDHERLSLGYLFGCSMDVARIIDKFVGPDDYCPKLDACTCDDGRGVDPKNCKCNADHLDSLDTLMALKQ